MSSFFLGFFINSREHSGVIGDFCTSKGQDSPGDIYIYIELVTFNLKQADIVA